MLEESPVPAEIRARRGYASRILPVCIYTMLVLYFGTARNSVVGTSPFPHTDKVLHALVFGGLAALSYRAFCWLSPQRKVRVQAVLAIAFAAFWGGLLEIVQASLGYRSAEWADFIADLLGAVLLVVVSIVLRLERPLRAFRS